MNRALLYLTALLCFIPFLHFPRAGGSFSLLSPFNLFVWEIAAGALFIAALRLTQTNTLVMPRQWPLILAMPLLLVLSGALPGTSDPVEWLFRSSALILGVLFFLALFQFQPNRRQIDTLLYIIMLAMLLHALVAFLQMLPGKLLTGIIPHPPRTVPAGVFLQPNLTASALVTGLVIALYQICSPGFLHRAKLLQMACFATLFMSALVVTSSGSRVGMLGAFIAIPLLLYARYPVMRHRREHLLAALLIILTGIAASLYLSDGLLKTYSKMARLASGSGEVRILVYLESVKLFLEQPFIGQGIGNFQQAFHNHMAEVMRASGGQPLLGTGHFTHPHNELLFWAIEGGIIALAGIFLAAGAVIWQLYRCGRQRGLALLALLLPLALHTQVEFPFYSSSFHWLTFLMLLFVVFSHATGTRQYTIGKTSGYSIATLCTALLIGTLMVCTSIFKTGRDLTTYFVYRQINLTELQQAEGNIYFNELATLVTNTVLLHDGMVLDQPAWVERYIAWAEAYKEQHPAPALYHDLMYAYNYLGLQEKVAATREKGLYMFPQHPYILSATESIAKGDRFIGMSDLRAESEPSSSTP